MLALLPCFAICARGEIYFTVAPSDRPGGRTFERREIRAADCRELVDVDDDEVPIVRAANSVLASRRGR